jgi:hypothetical protein
MAFTMACPNFKKGMKMVSGPLGVNDFTRVQWAGTYYGPLGVNDFTRVQWAGTY